MFDATPKHKIISATLALAAEGAFHKTSLLGISKRAGVSLEELRASFRSKDDILAGFVRVVDDAVLSKVGGGASGDEEPARDRLFDVIMTRFEVMTPYRVGLASIVDRPLGSGVGVKSACQLFSSKYWMLEAAGISAAGASGALRLAGLMQVYSAVFPVWLKDDEVGLPKTMAAVDQRLKSGAVWLERADKVCAKLKSVACCFAPSKKKSTKASSSTDASHEESVATAADPSGFAAANNPPGSA